MSRGGGTRLQLVRGSARGNVESGGRDRRQTAARNDSIEFAGRAIGARRGGLASADSGEQRAAANFRRDDRRRPGARRHKIIGRGRCSPGRRSGVDRKHAGTAIVSTAYIAAAQLRRLLAARLRICRSGDRTSENSGGQFFQRQVSRPRAGRCGAGPRVSRRLLPSFEVLSAPAMSRSKFIVHDELDELLGIEGEPLFADIVHWDRAMPQYHVGHCELVARFEARAAEACPASYASRQRLPRRRHSAMHRQRPASRRSGCASKNVQ